MRIAAIIPARGGSKRLPRKNLALLLDKPLLAWTIRAALGSDSILDGWLYVSTEDTEIARLALASGAKVVSRPAWLAEDHVWTELVLRHAVTEIEAERQERLDAIVWMNSCVPELLSIDVDKAVDLLRSDATVREVITVNAQGTTMSAARVLRRETLFQNHLSVCARIMTLPYIDIHTHADLEEAQRRILSRTHAGALD